MTEPIALGVPAAADLLGVGRDVIRDHCNRGTLKARKIGARGSILRAALHAPDRFGTFLALGITTMVVAQALLNLSVVLSLMPTKGIALPLVSSGGSSLLVTLASIGVLLNISQHAVHDGSIAEPGAA